MASRRDELNAYTFAKRRLIAQFVRPNSTGSEEGAPRPLRGVVPGMIVAVVILAIFGAWGMFKPVAPKQWDTPGENVIIASKSTTRYVVLKTGNPGKIQLHPVLNMSSAKLLLDPDKGKVINVDESVLDSGKIPHGATLGIPYAPDRLPDAKEAGAAKRWAVCERPGEGGRAIEKAAFVFAEREEKKTEGANQLTGGELMYVDGPDETRYIVDRAGKAYEIADDELLLRQVVGDNRKPQRVSAAWLDTLHEGDPIDFPTIDGTPGIEAGVGGDLGPTLDKVGTILKATDGTKSRHYVVLEGRVAPISDFTAKLLLSSRDLIEVGQDGEAKSVSAATFRPGAPFGQDKDWPQSSPDAVNSASTSEGSRNTVCSVLREVDADSGDTTLTTWAGPSFPATLPTGATSAYVTPGSGQLFRQFTGGTTKSGFLFLVTDTGLRYAMQSNGDSATDDSGIGESGSEKEKQASRDEVQKAQNRLGYQNVDAAPVPAAWSSFLPTGPRLSTGAAGQPQGS
ncbi:type VII secretion protein EccB [Streptomyces sp. IB2014 016-6]|uniref:type VII secretion protein EccB n=1 Tax=Streptomyces sp. IB2014 016-6 TaxID=2517818 RepID=UPI0011CAE9FE|nr:type VII secretion protein EccB [Streptomyces sp. IB2014 016-6]TXL84105.1 type VII secretion protein EccB [Streptomyces sp. IB2014 016-6]